MSDYHQLSGCRPMTPLDIVHFGYMLTWRTIVIFLIDYGCVCAYRLSPAMRILRPATRQRYPHPLRLI